MKSYYAMLLSMAALSLAVPARAADLVYLTNSADAIVVGATNSRLEGAERVSFDLAAERIIKGDTTITLFHVSHPWRRLGAAFSGDATEPINVSIHGLWFLRRSASGDWDVLPANGRDGMIFNLYLPATSVVPQRYAAASGASVLDHVVLEFAAGAEGDGNRIRAAVEVLRTARTPAIDVVTAAYLASPAPVVQSAGLTLSLAHNQPDAIATLVRLWPSVSTDPSRVQIAAALRDSYRDPSPAAIKQLAALAGDAAFSELRPAAIRALAAIHTKEALPALAELLQSSDPEERMTGVFGLSSFANGCPAQTPDNVASLEYLQFENPSPYRNSDTIAHFAFRRGPAEQEAELVSYWLGWWSKHKGELSN
jgi:hypothetical protein